MDYKKLYASKLCTAKEAVKDVTSGDWVDYGWHQWMSMVSLTSDQVLLIWPACASEHRLSL